MSQQSSGKTVQIQDPYLIINNQGNILPSFLLTKDYHRLGRDSSQVDLLLPSAWTMISRVQACLRKEGNSYRIYDGDGTNPSSNKLFINNRVITPHNGHLLHDGDEIKIGQNSQNWITINYYNSSQITAFRKPQQKSLSLLNRSVVLGRDPTSTLPLDAPTISRRHAVIDKNSQGQYILHDYSSNGVFVNGQKVNGSAILTSGCQIRLAPYTFTLQKDDLVLVDQGEYVRLDVRDIVQVVYGKNKQPLTIINRVSFPVEPAQFIALVGGSGAGKSTLMQILLGMQKPRDGMVYLIGEDLRKNFNIYRQQIGYVPQTDIIHRDLTVKEVLYFAAKLRLPKDLEVEEVIAKTLEEIELSDRQNTLVKELSGGQIKRVSIGVELLADPKLFFLDEPTSGLDPGLDKKMMQLLKKLAQEGRTIVLVTHATQNIQLCDRLAFLGKGGYLCYFGTPAGAMKFFNITSGDFADIYIRLESQEAVIQASQRFHNPHSQDYKKYIQDCLHQPPADTPNPYPTPQKAQAPLWRQMGILTQRYYRLILADKLSLIWALLTAPLGISLITLTLGKQAPLIIPESLNFNEVAKAAPLALKVLFVFTCASVWVGLSSSLQEIVKEIPIYLRERLVNLRLGAYLLSKVVVLGGLALVQSFLITLVIALRFASPESYLMPWFLGVYITTFLTLFASLNLGLMVSACVKNSSQANSILPIILLPQIIFSGVLFNIEKGANYLAWLMLSRWSIGAYGTLVGIEKFIKKAQEVNSYQAPLPFNDSQGVYDLSWQNLLINWGVLGVHSLCYLGITYLVQKRKDYT
jgi:ABC-type multidrug transport system ATPase subunit/pSer/pThr/pTyr-binding forkhead associated (FHA) protein/ABC-type multidrug transport system permease subunit